MRLAVNILHYGCVFSTLQCVAALCDEIALSPRSSFAVIVSSNGTQSDDDAIRAWAEKHFERCFTFCGDSIFSFSEEVGEHHECWDSIRFVLIRNRMNKGFAAGHNPGISLAVKISADAVWLLNNDSIVQPGAFDALKEAYCSYGDSRILGTTVVESDNPGVIQCAGGMVFNPYSTCVGAPLRGRSVEQIGQLENPAFDYIYGASILVPSKVFRDIGQLNEDYFLFYEELDFCKRATTAGYKLDWCRSAVVLHRSEERKGEQTLRLFHDARSFTIFAQNNYPRYWLAMACIHGLGRSFLLLIRGRVASAVSVLRGLCSGVSFLVRFNRMTCR